MEIHRFQKQYGLSNKDMAEVCMCSLPTIQKWRSGEVTPSGSARQLIKLLDYSAEGDPARLREVLSRMNRNVGSRTDQTEDEMEQLESSMTKVMDRLELMLESRRKDKALAESEARYRSMVQFQDDPVCRWKPDTTLTFVNEAYAKLYSGFGSDLIGQKWLDFIPPDKRSYVGTLVSDMVRCGEPEILNHESVDKDGNIRFQEWRDLPIHDERGNVVEFHSIGRDKTELFNSRSRISELEAIEETLLAASEYPFILFAPDGRLLRWNDPFAEEILSGRSCNSLGELFPALQKKRFNRLLERLTGVDRIVYRVGLPESQKLFTVWSVQTGNNRPCFLGRFQEVDAEKHPEIQSVRVVREIIVEDRLPKPVFRKPEAEILSAELGRAGQMSKVDGINVFIFDDESEVTNLILEWCAPGVKSQINDQQGFPFKEYFWWIKKIKKGQWIQFDDVEKMPRTSHSVRIVLQALGIASVMAAPLEVKGKIVGFLEFYQNQKPRLWHSQEIELLKKLKEKIEEHLVYLIQGETQE